MDLASNNLKTDVLIIRVTVWNQNYGFLSNIYKCPIPGAIPIRGQFYNIAYSQSWPKPSL